MRTSVKSFKHQVGGKIHTLLSVKRGTIGVPRDRVLTNSLIGIRDLGRTGTLQRLLK